MLFRIFKVGECSDTSQRICSFFVVEENFIDEAGQPWMALSWSRRKDKWNFKLLLEIPKQEKLFLFDLIKHTTLTLFLVILTQIK